MRPLELSKTRWGGPPGPRWSPRTSSLLEACARQADQGVGRGPGGPPYRWLVMAVLALIPTGIFAQTVTREGGRWVETITGTALPAARLRVNAQGPVHLEGGTAKD